MNQIFQRFSIVSSSDSEILQEIRKIKIESLSYMRKKDGRYICSNSFKNEDHNRYKKTIPK
jgi:hypothetical protein